MQFSEITEKYWTEKNWEDLEKVKTLKDLSFVALDVLSRMPDPIIEVCGPINNGGLGSFEANINMFNNTVIELQKKGFNVFDQMPFEEKIQEVAKNYNSKEKWVNSIQEDLYEEIFKTGRIKAFYFIKGWEKSHGSVWEHGKAKELNIEVFYL